MPDKVSYLQAEPNFPNESNTHGIKGFLLQKFSATPFIENCEVCIQKIGEYNM